MLARILRTKRVRYLSGIAYTPPKLDGLSKKWAEMDGPLKEEIVEYLTWKMEDDWRTMPRKEVEAAYFVSYGNWGPRSPSGQGQVSPTYFIWKGLFNVILFLALGVSVINLKRDKAWEARLEQLDSGCSSTEVSIA